MTVQTRTQLMAWVMMLQQRVRAVHGVSCPICIERNRPHPAKLLPQHRCRLHDYRDPRQLLTSKQWADEAEFDPKPQD